MKKSARFILMAALLPLSLASCGSNSQASSQCACVSIVSIVKTGSNGNIDIYTITYSDGTSSTFEIKNGEDGSQGEKGDKGDAGQDGENGKDGVDGENGKDGKDGSSILTGKGEPASSLGSNGDSYIDTETFDYYTKSGGKWTKAGNIKGVDGKDGGTGPTGAQGEKGSDGKGGSSILTGEGTPSSESGTEGDLYIDTSTGDIYSKGESAWTKSGNIKGKQGVSITKTEIDDNGHLIITYSDGTTSDAGQVKDASTHTVNFHVDDDLIDTVTVKDGTKLSAPSAEKTAGYSIKAWYTEEEGGLVCPWSFSGCVVTSDLDLYADFEYNQYEVTFVDEKYGTAIDALTVTYDQAYDFTKVTGKTGYTHAGWQDADDVSYGFSGTWRMAHDVTLYAEWPANEYTVTLIPNGGSVPSASIKVAYDSQYELPEPVRANYVFTGWYDSTGKKVSSKATWKGTEDATYTAKWSGVQNTYNFDAGDGSCSIDTMVIAYGASYKLPTPTVPDFNGLFEDLTFDGWYLDDNLIPQNGNWTYSATGGTLTARYKATLVNYGLYPQAHVSDEETIASLEALGSAESNGWYLLNGEYYAKISANPYDWEFGDRFVFDDGETIRKNETYWFKCDPIIWKILSSSNDEYSLVSTVLLDVHYDPSWSNNYANSGVRAWLNGDFYSSAFSLDDSLIQTTTVDNSAATTDSVSNSYACGNTNDKVYLLSYQDYKNTNYFADSTARQCKTTDWARANGAWCGTSSSDLHNGGYYTRSPSSSDSVCTWTVDSSGDFFDGFPAGSSAWSVRPSLRIKVVL